jgi:hypothetical protein
VATLEDFVMTISGMYSVAGMPNFANMTVGNVYFVGRKASATQFDMFARKFGKIRYADGSWCFHRDPTSESSTTADGTGIQEAITGSTGGMNNYIFCAPGSFAMASAALTLAGKSNTHLIAANLGDYDVGAPGSSLLQQTGAFACLTMNDYCEVMGFQFINKAGYTAITCPANNWRPTIHHNYFHMVGGADTNIIEATASAACTAGSIHHNKMSTWVGGILNAAIAVGYAPHVSVTSNVILASATATVLDYGILNDSIGGLTADNYVSECGGAGVVSNGGTITVAISVDPSGTAINNRTAVGTGQGLAGGTSSHSFVDNRDGQAGGETAIET